MPIRPEHRHFYTTPSWIAARAQVLARAQGGCERCGRPGGSWLLSSGGVWFDPAWGRWRAPASILVDLRPPSERGVFVPQPEEARLVLTQLGVAHIDHDPGRQSLSNLAAWCRQCHLWHDQPEHKRTRQMHRDLKRPLLQMILQEKEYESRI